MTGSFPGSACCEVLVRRDGMSTKLLLILKHMYSWLLVCLDSSASHLRCSSIDVTLQVLLSCQYLAYVKEAALASPGKVRISRHY